MERGLQIAIVDDCKVSVEKVSSQLRVVPGMTVSPSGKWVDGNDIPRFVDMYDVVITDCTGAMVDNDPFKMGEILWKNNLFLKIVLHSIRTFTKEQTLNLLTLGFLAVSHKGECHFCEPIISDPKLLNYFLDERESLLVTINKQKNELNKKRLLILGYNIFNYYMEYPKLITEYKDKFVAFVDGSFVKAGDNESDLAAEVFDDFERDVFLVRQVRELQ